MFRRPGAVERNDPPDHSFERPASERRVQRTKHGLDHRGDVGVGEILVVLVLDRATHRPSQHLPARHIRVARPRALPGENRGEDRVPGGLALYPAPAAVEVGCGKEGHHHGGVVQRVVEF